MKRTVRGPHAPADHRNALVLVAVVTLVLLAAAGPTPAVGADTTQLTPRFAVNGGNAYTNSPRVRIGDRGWSPFFEPGVVVWDGGSIIGGYRATPGMEYPAQTLRLVPHPVRSLVSSSPGAMLVDMIAEASVEVDAWYRADADADVCVVMAGAVDVRSGRDIAAIHDDLRSYCLARRAAGFRVVVLTLLPRGEPEFFEGQRQVFNDLVRADWPTYADGLADVAADSRIGDHPDCFNLQYFQRGAVHPNDAGYAVMAVVTAPLLNQLPWRSGDCEVRIRNAGGEWTAWAPYSARLSWQLGEEDGLKTVEIEYRDGEGTTVAASDSIRLDTVKPVTRAPYAAYARRGQAVSLRYRVADAAPCGPRASTVTIKVRNHAGAVVKTIRYRGKRVNMTLGATFTVPATWRTGTYTFSVYATDNAGNAQARVGRNTLTVR